MNFLDLGLQYESIKQEINSAVKRVLDSLTFIGGKEVEEFEKEIALFCGIKYAVGVNSGTDALFLSLKALNIGAGDEVITTPFTFIATAGVIANCGAKPVFVDINPETFNIDSSKIEEKITGKTKAILPVHLFGQMADMDEIMAIAKKHNLFVIEDAAQAIGAEYKGKKAGTIGDLGCFSFFPSKNLGACGDGGMVVTNDAAVAESLRMLRNHGARRKYYHEVPGFNSRLDGLQAAVLRVKLRHLDDWIRQRRRVAALYAKHLGEIPCVTTPYEAPGSYHCYNYYTVRLKSGSDRAALQKSLS